MGSSSWWKRAAGVCGCRTNSNAPLWKHKYAVGARGVEGGGALLTQPDGEGQRIKPRRFYKRWQEPGCGLERTSELCTFPSRLAGRGMLKEGDRETLKLFPAAPRSWSTTLGKSLTVTLCLERDNRSLVCCGCRWRQCGEPGWWHGPSLLQTSARGRVPPHRHTWARPQDAPRARREPPMADLMKPRAINVPLLRDFLGC